MKKLLFITLIVATAISCKKEVKSEKKEVETTAESSERTAKQSDGLTLLKGDFVYHGGAAVLQTHAEIYGVLPVNKFEELSRKAEAFKTEPTDMVQVEIRGKITNEKHETILWENKVEVVEIINVKPIDDTKNNIVKLGS
ncbi:hypothetical protein [Hyunsoonleella pacifica]|uniref:NlpE C-terminal OB domain-containing protein n=1 Tax=Hyunsoonleella pacifica TaxID=1080224 RepID=A0A4Q9FNI2_9FLAO|nr:hypothetical protein [Hyunsoonleella pacifica]TBN15811.1 hypothetical protein EYD46_11880 [Hyunsoonleella pacifica]GGD22851.1 hypothetical protein GCM10011368_26160 [Hyunsoonleella pacifica]